MLIGASARLIRDLEQIGFIARVGGTAGSRRAFSQMLRLARRGRDLGLTIERALILLQLWRARSDADAGTIAHRHADALKRHITDIQAMVSALEHLASFAKSDARGDGPNRNDMANDKAAIAPAGRARLRLRRNPARFAAEKAALAPWCASTERRT
ncbi:MULTISPECIES: MerR family DNA-binding protein [Sphingopyxis]|nr:MerR family DNA-binding protein [Sphingopyxis fribergensis]